MKTTILKTNKLLIVLTMMLSFGPTAFSQIAVPDSVTKKWICDASFKDMLPLILLPANADMSNLVALGPVDQNDYNKDYFWDLGDGTLDTGKIITHNYAQPGRYLVTLHTVQHIIGFVKSFEIECSKSQWVTTGIGIDTSASNCSASFSRMTVIPTIYSTINLAALYANQLNASYSWDLGDGTKSSSREVYHNYAQPGKYLVTLKVYNQNVSSGNFSLHVTCEDSSSQWIEVGLIDSVKTCDASFQPLILATADHPTSYAEVVGFNADLNHLYQSYHWDFGDGTQDTGRTVKHFYKADGKYLVSLTVKDSNCTDTKSMWISKPSIYPIDNTLRCNARISKTIKENTVTFYDQPIETLVALVYDGNYETWTWDFGDGELGYNSYVSHTYAKPGKYQVTLTKSSFYNPCYKTPTTCYAQPILRCTNTYQFEVIIGESNSLCNSEISYSINGFTIEVNDNGFDIDSSRMALTDTVVSRTWLFGDSSITFGTGAINTHTYSKPGNYRITLIKNIFISHEQAAPSTTELEAVRLLTPICSDTSYLDISIGTFYPTCKANVHYTISGRNLQIGDSQGVQTIHKTLLNNNTYTVAMWDFGDGSSANGLQSFHEYASSGKYTVRFIKSVWNDPCPVLDSSMIKCLAMPYLVCTDTTYYEIEIKDTKCSPEYEIYTNGNTITVVASNIGEYIGYSKLEFGDGDIIETNGNNLKATHTYAQKGDHTICFYVATVPDSILPYVKLAYYCNDTFCKTITISDSVSNPIVASIYPNPASDYMTVSVKNNFNKMDLRLYDQTGKLKKEVFEIQSDSKEIDTEGLENGLYFYTLSDGGNVVLKGKIAVSK